MPPHGDHDHGHSHDGDSYLYDQICMVVFSLGLAAVAVLMYFNGMLDFLLAPGFHVPLLAGGGVLATVTVVRAVTLWGAAGSAHSHHHDHDHNHDDHGHDHDHDHHHHADHDHGHDHGWSPWKYTLLLAPIMLFLLGIPNKGFSTSFLRSKLGTESIGDFEPPKAKEGQVFNFKELESAAYNSELRKIYEGQKAVLSGQYLKIKDKEFTLFRMKGQCCAGDATVQLQVRIVSKKTIMGHNNQDWVQVTGRILFKEQKPGQYITVLYVENPARDIEKTESRGLFEA